MFDFFRKSKAWKPHIIETDRIDEPNKTLIVFCGSNERGTSTIADYFVRELSKYDKVCVMDISESRSFYMKYIYEEKLCDEEMSEALINLEQNINKPLEYFEDCFLYSMHPFNPKINMIDFTKTIQKLFLQYNYIVVDMSIAYKEILDMAKYICVVAGTDVLKCYKDKIYLQNICENLENAQDKSKDIHILLNKVSNKFANKQLMMELLNNKSNDIYYSNIKFEIINFFEVTFLEKIYKNPLGLVNLGNSSSEKVFKNNIENIVKAFR